MENNCFETPQQPEFEEKECVEFIYKELIADGLHVSEEVIAKVLELEFNYLVKVGIAVEAPEEEV